MRPHEFRPSNQVDNEVDFLLEEFTEPMIIGLSIFLALTVIALVLISKLTKGFFYEMFTK